MEFLDQMVKCSWEDFQGVKGPNFFHFRADVIIQSHYLELNCHDKILPQSFNAKKWLLRLNKLENEKNK